MRITVKSNVYFKRLKGKKVPNLIFEHILKSLGRAALTQVKKTFKSDRDINGEHYLTYEFEYQEWKERIGKGQKPIMELSGKLKNSLPIKMFTNPEANRVIIRPDFNKAKNKNGEFYGAYHLNGRAKGGKVRKWFYTSDELPTLLTDSKLLGNVYKFSKKNFERELQKELKGKMRIIAGKKIKF
tara:strand:- start:363 stop:914 length:552 start_codon:yes stop_codon:yes gene_type:complete